MAKEEDRMSNARALIEQLQAFHAQARIDDVGSYERLTALVRI